MFVPSTYAFYRHLVGNEFVYNKSFPWRTHHWQQNTMDYRRGGTGVWGEDGGGCHEIVP